MINWTGKSTDGSWNKTVKAETMFDLYIKLVEDDIVTDEFVLSFLRQNKKYSTAFKILGDAVDDLNSEDEIDVADKLTDFERNLANDIIGKMSDNELQALIEYNDGTAYRQKFEEE